MARKEAPRAFAFDAAALAEITAALPRQTPTERAVLLPELLRIWAEEDLREHLAYESRAVREQEKQLSITAELARRLLAQIAALDPNDRFLLAFLTKNSREEPVGLHEHRAYQEGAAVTEKPLAVIAEPAGDLFARIAALDTNDCSFLGHRTEKTRQLRSEVRWEVLAKIDRRDAALCWLEDMAEGLAAKPPPEKSTRSYRIVLDLAAIFELITNMAPTRRINASSGKPYGPFLEFCEAVGRVIGGIGSLDTAIRDVVRFYSKREHPALIANLQLRHNALWKKLAN